MKKIFTLAILVITGAIVAVSHSEDATSAPLAPSRPLSYQAQPWSPHPGPPPRGVLAATLHAADHYLVFPGFTGEVFIYPSQAKIKILWSESPGKTYAIQDLVFPYWVNAVSLTNDEGGLFVSGKRRSNGNTVIDKYTFSSPKKVIDITTGKATLTFQGPSSTTNLYDSAVEGRDYGQMLVTNRGRTDSVFVRFWDSSDIYDVGLVAGVSTLSLVASPLVTSGAPHLVPELTDTLSGVWSADHSVRGYVYVFSPFHMELTTAPNCIVFSDVNRSGNISASEVVLRAQWEASDLSSSSQYL